MYDLTAEPAMPRLFTRTLPLALVAVFFTPGRASAKFLITYAERSTQVGEVVPQARQKLQQKMGRAEQSIEFKYHAVGVFWIDVWTWGGSYYIPGGRNGTPITEAEAAEYLGVAERDLVRPFFYRWPVGLLILCGATMALIPMALSRLRAERKVRRLLEDQRYREARRILSAHSTQQQTALAEWERVARQAEAEGSEPPPPLALPEDDGWEAAIGYLVEEGVPPEEAEKNLTAILTYLDNKPRLKV